MEEENWNSHIGSVWAQLLQSHSLHQKASVIEVGPGFADKIGLGLAANRFQGTLYVIEPNDAARRWAIGRYRKLLENAEIIPVAQPVSAAGRILPDHVDGLLMNHVLDDMILLASLKPRESNGELDQIWSNGETVLPRFREKWQHLLDDQPTLRAVSQMVLDDLDRLVEETNPRIFGTSQYSSWFLNDNNLEEVDLLGARLLGGLAGRIGQTSDPDRAVLRRFDQDPDRWLFFDRYSATTEVE